VINYLRNLRGAALLILLLSFLAFLLLTFTTTSSNPEETSVSPFQLGDKDRLIYLEAISRIKEEALFPPPPVANIQAHLTTLKSYLIQKDPYSGYLTRDEYRKFQELQGEEYVGIGLELERDRNGNTLCFPYPGSAAEKAGFQSSDRLLRIGDTSITGKSLLEVVSLARGISGTKIDLTVLTPDGLEKRITLTRQETSIKTVFKRHINTVPIIKLLSFTRNTKTRLETLIAPWPENKPIIIDLRGNRGGDLHAAIDSAKLFLKHGAPIVSIRGRTPQEYKNDIKALNTRATLYLWQDEKTASAAEVFIAALVENHRARSIGRQTFGKGTKQDIIELSDGSALILTTGELLTPSGSHYDGKGLMPTVSLDGNANKTVLYLAQVKSLERSK
jgi:carboxyl-terminal processing protease